MSTDLSLIGIVGVASLFLAVHVTAFDGGGMRSLQATYLTPGSTNQTYPNATLVVSPPTNETACADWYHATPPANTTADECLRNCIISGFNGIPSATVTGPLIVNVTTGDVAQLSWQTEGDTYLALSGIEDAPYYRDLLAPADAKTGILYFRFAANSTTPGQSVSLAAGLAADMAGGANRLAPPVAPAVPLCVLNVTFTLVNVSDRPQPVPYCPDPPQSGNIGFCNNGQNNTGNYNTGYNNRGSYNVGNNNTGNFNMGTGNIGNCNKGSFNRGNGNVGSYLTADLPCPEGTPGAQSGPSIVPGSVADLTAVGG